MESIIGLAVLALRFLLIAFVLTAVVGAWFLRRELTSAQFWRMFGVSCVILLILNARACGNL